MGCTEGFLKARPFRDHLLTLCTLRGFPIPINTIRRGLSITYFKVEISKIWCSSDPEHCFFFYLSKLQRSTAFHQGLHCLQKYLSRGFQYLCLLLSSADNLWKQFGPRPGPTNVGPDLDPNCMTLKLYSWKKFSKRLVLKKSADDRKKSMKNYPGGKELKTTNEN